MKPWMKALMWALCGAGFGYFIGDRIGYRRAMKEQSELMEETTAEDDGEWREKKEEAVAAMREYAANYDTELPEPATDEDPEMPTESDIAIDPDIPQLHPQHLVPEIIGEEEYNLNIWQYDLENLLFYEMDEVLYNESTQSIIENPDDVIGIGTLFEFGGDPNNPVESIFVKNDTYGTLFRIDRLDAAFCDAVDGSCPPEDDEPEEEDDDFSKDDYWNDV